MDRAGRTLARVGSCTEFLATPEKVFPAVNARRPNDNATALAGLIRKNRELNQRAPSDHTPLRRRCERSPRAKKETAPAREAEAALVITRRTKVDLYKFGDIYDNSLRLVRPTGLVKTSLPQFAAYIPPNGRSPGICGNFLRPAPRACPCFRRHAAIPRIGHPAAAVIHSDASRQNLSRLGKGGGWNYKRRRRRGVSPSIISYRFEPRPFFRDCPQREARRR
jgi:hypothetical protein